MKPKFVVLVATALALSEIGTAQVSRRISGTASSSSSSPSSTVGLGSTQSTGQNSVVRVDVPFDFHVSNKKMPAGKYYASLGPGGVVAISSIDGAGNVFVAWLPQESSNKVGPRLTFRRYGETYFLAEVWTGGKLGGRIYPSKLEREYVSKLPADRTVVVAERRQL